MTVQRFRLGKFNWLALPQLLPVPLLSRLEQPEQLLLPPANPLKKVITPGREVVRLCSGETANTEVVVKHFTPRGLGQHIKWTWRASPAIRAFCLARELATLGLLTPTPVAAGERRTCGFLRESFLVTHFIAGATPLHLVNAHCADRRRRIGIVRGLAKLYAALHDAGFFHGDPSQSNFLVVPHPGGSDAIALIDLDGLRRRREMNLSAAVRDLQRLLLRGRIPRRERAWFIVTYSRSRKLPVDVRQLLALIGLPPAQATFPHCALNEESQPEFTE